MGYFSFHFHLVNIQGLFVFEKGLLVVFKKTFIITVITKIRVSSDLSSGLTL